MGVFRWSSLIYCTGGEKIKKKMVICQVGIVYVRKKWSFTCRNKHALTKYADTMASSYTHVV